MSVRNHRQQTLDMTTHPASISRPTSAERARHPLFLQQKTWQAFGYHWAALLLAPFGFTYAVLAVSLGASLLVTGIGLIVPAAMVAGARGWGALNRGLIREVLGTELPVPASFAPKRGFFGFLRSGLSDAAGWRALAHMLLSFILAVTSFVLSVTLLASALGSLTYWYWYRFLPEQQNPDGTLHRGTPMFPEVYADTPVWFLIYAAAGLLLLVFIWPWVNNGTARLQTALAAGLLTPTASSLRVQELQESRSASVDNADARLHRIERDLHDGTQAQLVAIAMKTGDVRDRLSTAQVSPEVLALLDSAHGTAKTALADLRGLARGIRPAALADGLDTALETLAAGTPVPTDLTYRLDGRPDPSIEAIAYYCASELVNNAVKHANAGRIGIAVSGNADSGMRLTVSDDGDGGAASSPGVTGDTRTGLSGLRQRLATVDGSLDIVSPAGGPTKVTVSLPLSSKA